MDISWEDARLFLAVVDSGSLSAAARQLRVAQPTVSRRVAELEALLGEPLFGRGVGGAALTPFGERLVEPARRMAECAAEFTRVAEHAEDTPRGVVRVTTPPGLAFDFVAPFAVALRETLPDVRLEVVSTLRYLDLVRREADLAVRFKQPSSRDLVTVAEWTTGVAAFASPAYAASLSPGYAVRDLDWIAWAPPLDHLSPNPELAATIPNFRPVFASDDFLVQLRAAEAGMGAMVLARAWHRFTRLDMLTELDVSLGPVQASAFLVTTRSALAIPRVRAVAELLAEEFKRVRGKRPRRLPQNAPPSHAAQ
jgi:molybdate transport repressor ModE-like protein